MPQRGGSGKGNPSPSGGYGKSGGSGGRGHGASRGASRGHLGGAVAAKKKVAQKVRPARPEPQPQSISTNREHGFGGGKRPYDYSFYEKEPATPEYLARLFASYQYEVSPRELDAYWKYYCLLRDRNAELDLTRIMGIEATVLKHFIDCAIVADLAPLSGPLLDIGSGPGFPGAPIAIRRPDLHVILAESRGKRVRFLEELKETLGLDNVEIYPRSVREDSKIAARSIVTRAVEIIPATLQRVCPFLAPGGEVLFMKGPGCGQEVTDAQQQFKGVYKMTGDIRYDLPGTDQKRRLVIFARRDEEPVRSRRESAQPSAEETAQ